MALAVLTSKPTTSMPTRARGNLRLALLENDTDAAISRGAALGDLDGDGDLDVFVANYNQANRIYINEGAGEFTASAIIVDDMGTEDMATNFSQGVALGDLDGDGDLDAFVANYSQPNRIYTQQGE